MPKTIFALIIGLTMFLTENLNAQDLILDDEPQNAPLPIQIVDFPTAATLSRGTFTVELDAFGNGGIISYIDIGLHDRFMLGISYGGEGILGHEDADWYERPNYLVKLRILDEKLRFPSIAVGFHSQGTGPYDEDLERFRFKAPGFFVVFSKGYRALNWLAGVHGGVHYNPLEDDIDKDDDVSFYGGFDIVLNNSVSMVTEYQVALNDDRSGNPYGRGRGYLNAGLIWKFSERLELGAIFKDLLNNSRATESITRELRITYSESF